MENIFNRKTGAAPGLKEELIKADKYGADPINPRGSSLDMKTGSVESREGTNQRWGSGKNNGGYYKQ